MKRPLVACSLLVAFLAAGGAQALAGSEVGDTAPAVEPQGWFNNKGPVSWAELKGRLILVEKWATW
ncbi:MAG: hypothetical protein ACE5GW_01520 [Planctomycetota bacterium]